MVKECAEGTQQSGQPKPATEGCCARAVPMTKSDQSGEEPALSVPKKQHAV